VSKREIEQRVHELAGDGSTLEEVYEEFGLANVCERCGRKGLNDEGYTDCEATDTGLVCRTCLATPTEVEA
jgi:hypothetical protein